MFTSSHLLPSELISKLLLHFLCVIALLPLQHQLVPSNQSKHCQNFNTGIFDKSFEEKYETVDFIIYNCLLFKYTFFMSSNKWYQDFTFASFFKSLLCCLKGSSNKKNLSPNHLNLIFLIGVWYSSFWSDGLKTT